MKSKKIFTFWEPKDNIPAYLELCKKTWEKHLSDYEVVILDYENLGEYLDSGVYNIDLLKQLSLSKQKDAILVAVLKEHGGIFMDLDTIVLRDISPILEKGINSDLLMFNNHLAFVLAKSNGRLINLWLEKVQKQIANIPNVDLNNIHWGYAGNVPLTELLDETVNRLWFEKFMQLFFPTELSESLPLFIRNLEKYLKIFYRKRKTVYFRTVFKSNLMMLSSAKWGFIVEADDIKKSNLPINEVYRAVWFNENSTLQKIINNAPIIIGLHNSWTPKWYLELTEEELFEVDCLMSKTLAYALQDH